MFRFFYEAIFRGCVTTLHIFKKHVYALVHCSVLYSEPMHRRVF
jgi:hypothetical protein